MAKKILILISTVLLLFSIAFAGTAEEVSASSDDGNPKYTLPIDFSPGMEADPNGFVIGDKSWFYEDPTIRVEIEQKRTDNCDYWVARIKIGDASQLRTAAAGGFESTRAMKGVYLAKRVKAVLAIDGDYFCYTGIGYIVRQGEEFLNRLKGTRDVLLIDEDGDFHCIIAPENNMVSNTVNGKKVINSLFFGPLLVDKGVAVEEPIGESMAQDEPRQRMAIAQTGHLEYMAICCASLTRGSAGMTLKQFAKLCADEGAYLAYNLDGGNSTMMIFNYKKINDVENGDTREISDIVYFASAWPGEEAER